MKEVLKHIPRSRALILSLNVHGSILDEPFGMACYDIKAI